MASPSLRTSRMQAFRPIEVDDAFAADASALLVWYRSQKRELPWRADRDPYRIWISEVMLQQTTVAAVIPYYLRFLEKFPNVRALAQSPVEDVLQAWAGLGYYSRARNLHKSAQALAASGFPRTKAELLKMPGFGPYTARAVASLAFDERVGVLDGNVIRVLTRVFGLAVEWWRPQERDRLQELADRIASGESPHDWNQAMMELGATVCAPSNPACLLCPWNRRCIAWRESRQGALPLRRPRRERETWLWKPAVLERRATGSAAREIALVKNDYAPFLKGHWILPGTAELKSSAPKSFDFRGTVTHRDIFVQLEEDGAALRGGVQWAPRDDLAKWAPASLVEKAVAASERRANAFEAGAARKGKRP